MAIGDPYMTVAEFKARVGMGTTTEAQDAAILVALKAASRQIDGMCGRQFNKSATSESRLFDCPDRWRRWSGYADPCFDVGDIVSVGAIASDDGTGAYATAWDASSYYLFPRNASLFGLPYTQIAPAPGWSSGAWPITGYPVRITGIFGWPAVPEVVKEVCQLLANRQKSLWTAPFGTTGGGELGSGLNMTAAVSPLVGQMLAPYRVMTV